MAWSGGAEPGVQVNPAADRRDARTRHRHLQRVPQALWTDETVRAADVVITLGCGDACPIFPGKRYEEGVLDHPAGLDLPAVRPIRDEIARRVRALLEDLGVPVTR